MEKIIRGIGFLCFIALPITVMFYLGFRERPEVKDVVILFPDLKTVIIYNTILGLVGGLFLTYFQKPLDAILRSLMVTIFLTSFAYLYMFWRRSIINYEILIMYLPAIPAMFLYEFLAELIQGKRIVEEKNDSKEKEESN